MRRVRDLNRVRRLTAVATVAAALCALPVGPAIAAPTADGVQLNIEGVGVGTFAEARLAMNPASGDEQPDPLCLTLEGASPTNAPMLVDWMRATLPEQNETGIPTLPDATLTVMSDRPGVKRGVYRLSDVSVRHVQRDEASGGRVDRAEITCSAVDPASRAG